MWQAMDVNSGKFAVTALDGSLAISSNKFTVAGNTATRWWRSCWTHGDYVEQLELELRRCRAHWMCGA